MLDDNIVLGGQDCTPVDAMAFREVMVSSSCSRFKFLDRVLP